MHKFLLFCHFYAEIVKFGLILTHLSLFWDKCWAKIFLGKMPPCGATTGHGTETVFR